RASLIASMSMIRLPSNPRNLSARERLTQRDSSIYPQNPTAAEARTALVDDGGMLHRTTGRIALGRATAGVSLRARVSAPPPSPLGRSGRQPRRALGSGTCGVPEQERT